jgi:tetratricopeptide (TPR) repeat protein
MPKKKPAPYPDYVQRTLAQARLLLDEEDYSQPDAAALCFDLLALFPDLQEASDLVLEAFNNPELIRDKRKALGRMIDEWDDRSWQQRRRLALSFRYMSRWEDRYEQYKRDPDHLPDVAAMLDEGRNQLLQDYLLGQSQGRDLAWSIFQEAFRRARNPQAAMLWVGHLYAEQGYFAESVELLEELLVQFPRDEKARRLWAEVRWWRDNQHRIPWIPPATGGDGQRFRRMMSRMDPDFAADPEAYMQPLDHMPPDPDLLPADFAPPPSLDPDLENDLAGLLGEMPLDLPPETAVDWHYLDILDSGHLDLSLFPTWAQQLLAEVEDTEHLAWLKYVLLSHLSSSRFIGEEE